jgi:AcrR family transcriptional regulator
MDEAKASRPPRAAKAPRGERTRERLIEATIECIGRYGYAGATTEVIAKHADITRGPLQYYFSDRVGLVHAAFERLHGDLMVRYAKGTKGASNPREVVDRILDINYAICRSEAHYAMIEIIIASRSDSDLRARIEPLLAETNTAVDANWASSVGAGGSSDQLVAVRYLMVAITRGLALNSLTFADPELFEREFALTRKLAHSLLGTS